MNKKQKSQLQWGIVIAAVAALIIMYYATRPTYEGSVGERPFKGSADAAVLVEEFSDFQCPACGATYPVLKSIAQQYGDQIRFEYKHFPLTRIHPEAFNAALASECANDQGKFWEMHDAIFENQRLLNKAMTKTLAKDLGLDTEAFNACLDSRARAKVVQNDVAEGNKRGVNSTPSIFVNGEKVQVSQLTTVIDAALAAAQ